MESPRLQSNSVFGLETPCLQSLGGWLAAGFLCLWLGASLEAASVKSTLDRDTTTVGESVQLTLIFEGVSGEPGNLPGIANLIIEPRGRGQSFQSINGQSSISSSYYYLVTPQQPGEYTIPAFSFQAGREVFSTQPLKLKVLKSDIPGASGNNALDRFAFLRLVLPKTNLYLGEVLPLDIQLYVTMPDNIQMPQLRADGFTLGKFVAPSETNGLLSQTRFNGQQYQVYTFKTSVSAAKTGELALGPVQCNLNLLFPVRRRDPFNFPSMFGPDYQARPVMLTNAAQTVHVQPLPAQNVPAHFNGAMGVFSMKVQAGPTNVMVGDPVTVKISITGRGTLDSLILPPLDEGANFKSFALTNRIDTTDLIGMEGAKSFEYVLTPQNTEVKELPAIQFSFFDPEQKTYRTLEQPPLPITVRATGIASAAPVLPGNPSGRESSPAVQDIVNIKARLGAVSLLGPPLILRAWFLALLAAPILAWSALVLWKKYQENLNRNPRLRRQRQVARLLDRGLVDLRRYAEANNADAFYATAFRLLQEQLGERLDLPATAITEAVIEERLRPLGVPEEILDLVQEVFQRCNQHRYAPTQESRGLFFQFPKVEAALKSLKNLGLVLAFWLSLSAMAVQAGDLSAPFEEANKLYAQGKYEPAALACEKILQTGQGSAAIYFNAGNAWFKAGSLGKSIAAYLHARELAPRDNDIRANLRFVRSRVNPNNPTGGDRWQTRLNWLTWNEGCILTAGLIWIWFGLLTARLWKARWKNSLSSFVKPAAWLAVAASLGLALRLQAWFSFTPAVVTVKEAAVRYGPLEESRVFFQLNDGAEIEVMDQQKDWIQIKDSLRRVGWLRVDQLRTCQIGREPANVSAEK